ncbi:MAG: VanZ family protein [Clostridia bacterium]|nr:VanZ family protein [Clostridia bacterium]
MTKREKAAGWVYGILIGATLLFIWGHSLTPASQSQAESDKVKWLLSLVLGDGAVTAFLLENIRKVAHFGEFALLGGELALAGRRLRLPRAWLYGLGVAAVDEVLQLFAPGRAPMVADVLLDYSGYLCGFGLIALLAAGLARLCRKVKK